MSDSKIEKILSAYDSRKKINKQFTEKIRVLISDLLRNENIEIHSIESRLKERSSLKKKIENKPDNYRELDEITDICGLRIITYFESDVDKVASLIEQEFKIDEENSIDKRTSLDPDRFGYLSLHYVLSLNDDRLQLTENKNFLKCKAEVQIRSILQHAWAEIEHDLGYKTKEEVPKHIRRQFSRLAGLLELADQEFDSVKNQLSSYAEQVSDKVEKEDEDLQIDKITTESFIKNSTTLLEIDKEIASIRKAKLLSGDSSIKLYSRLGLSILKYFDFEKFSEFESILEKEKDNIIEFAKIWLSKDYGKTYRGIGIFYFGYYYAASQNDINTVIDYLSSTKIGGEPTELAERVFETYKKVVGE